MAILCRLLKQKDTVSSRLNDMVKRGSKNEAFLIRVVYRLYRKHQSERWQTENASEGEKWPAYKNKKYAEWKRLNFAGYPFNGETMNARTGKLFQSVTGMRVPSDVRVKVTKEDLVLNENDTDTRIPKGYLGHNVLVTEKQLVVASALKYASVVNQQRNFWKFNDEINNEISDFYRRWFVYGG